MNELVDSAALRGPARPEKLTVTFFEEPDGIAIHKKRGGGPGAFLLIWLIGWTVGCVWLGAEAIKNPAAGTIAFAVPFWASWLAMASLLVWILFGSEMFLLRSDKAIFVRRALVTLSSRAVPRDEIRSFREFRSHHTGDDEHLPVWGIEMVTLGKPLRFAFRLPDRERDWLLHQLNRYLNAPQQATETATDRAIARPVEKPAESEPAGEMALTDVPPAACETVTCETMTFARTLPTAPSDSAWQIVDDWNVFEFCQRGRLSLMAVPVLLFINLFWNGIVSVFLMVLLGLMPGNNQPQGWEWWGLFFFLIPFEVIGLAMFAAFVLALLEPFRRTSWRFEQDRIEKRSRWPLYRRTRTWPVASLDRLELRRLRDGDAKKPSFTGAAQGSAGESPFELVFVGSDNVDLCNIAGLTEGEARWLARAVLDQRAAWFGK